jgi:hypothetical protein
MPEPTSFRGYYKQVLAQLGVDVRERVVANLTGVLTLVLATVLLAEWRVNAASQTYTRILVGLVCTIVSIVAYGLFYFVRSPWKIHNDTVQKHEDAITTMRKNQDKLQAAIESLTADLNSERTKNGEAELSSSAFRECLVDVSLSNPDELSGTVGHGSGILCSYLIVSTYIVNTRPITVSLRDWRLEIELNGQVYKPRAESLDSNWRVTRRVFRQEGFELRPTDRDEQLTPVLNERVTFGHNEGITVWSSWLLAGLSDHEFKDTATFTFTLTDSRGKTHSFARPPAPWPETGRLVAWR